MVQDSLFLVSLGLTLLSLEWIQALSLGWADLVKVLWDHQRRVELDRQEDMVIQCRRFQNGQQEPME